MHIGIVLHPYNEKRPAGLGRYALDFTRSLLDAGSTHRFTVFVKGHPPRPDFLRKEDNFVGLGNGPLWLDRINDTGIDLVVFNTPRLPFFRKPKKSVTIALDFAYQMLPQSTIKQRIFAKFLSGMHRRSLERAEHIIAISEATKKDTVALFGIRPEKITVVYPGFSDIAKKAEKAIPVPSRFFLSVGVIKNRKNVLAAVQGFLEFRNERSDISFVIVGNDRGTYADTVKAFVAEHTLQEQVMFLKTVSDAELSFLYKRAEALIYPSLIEGFGFPILEAMSAGLPVITSNQSSLKEVGQDGAALLIDPTDPHAIAEAMKSIVSSVEVRSACIAKGRTVAGRFSWEKSARETLVLLESLI